MSRKKKESRVRSWASRIDLRRHVAPAAALGIGVLLSLALFGMARAWERRQRAGDFRKLAADRIEALRSDAASDLVTVRALASFYASSRDVERQEFRKFTESLLSWRPDVQALGWAPRVRGPERAAWEETARRDGLAGFRITEKSQHGVPVRAGPRDEYFPIYYVEPFQGNEAVLGQDLASNPVLREGFNRSRDTGAVVAVEATVQAREASDGPGIVMFAPVYRDGVPAQTIEGRREALQGFVLRIFSIRDCVEPAIQGLSPGGVDLHFFDDSASGGARRLYTHDSRTRGTARRTPLPPDADRADDLDATEALEVADLRWRVLCTPAPGFAAGTGTWQPWAVLACGLLLSGMLAGYLAVVKSRTARVELLAGELLETNQRLEREARSRERAEAAAAIFRGFVEASGQGFGIADLEGNITYVNRAICRMVGEGRPEDCLGKPLGDYYPREIQHRLKSEIIPAVMQGEQWVGELALASKGGATVPTMENFFLIRGADGEPLFLADVISDITERKEAEREQKRQSESLQAIFAASPVGMLLFDENLVITELNGLAAKLAGKSTSQMIGLRAGEAINCVHACDDPDGCGHGPRCPSCPIRRALEAVLRSGQAVHRTEVKAALVIGDTQVTPWLEISAEPVTIQGERRVIASVANITDRKNAEQALRESKEKYQSLFDSSADAIMTLRPQEGFLNGNPAAIKIFGCRDEEELTSLTPAMLSPELQPDGVSSCQRAQEMMATAMERGSHFFEWRHKRLDGGEFDATVLLTRVMLDGQATLQATVRDVTEQKRWERELARAKEAAEAATKAKSLFLANMSHEIRTPMTAILGYTDLIAEGIGCCPRCSGYESCETRAANKEHLAVIRRNGNSLLDLINNILDLSKIEAGKVSVETGPCSLASLMADVASVMRIRADERGISLGVEYAGAIPETIQTDGFRLRQALVNLVGNAVKFTERGGVRIVTSFLPDWRGRRPAVRIQVIDTGIGISEDKIPRLFDPFVQADPSTTRKYGGTGLGLVITRHIAELLDGELTAESTIGQGSIFTLTVPTGSLDGVRMLARPAEAVTEGPTPDDELPAGGTPLTGLRILLAEDGADNQLLIATTLRKAGAEVRIVENGQVAVAHVEAAGGEDLDVILMDMQMPEMDGYEATRILREKGLTHPIIALTAHAMSGDRAKCLSAGCTDYCSKPIHRADLIATVARHARQTVGGEANGVDRGREPIRSELADDPDVTDILEEFIRRLPDTITAMRQALANNHHEELRRLAHQLKGAGGGYGYPCLTAAAKALEDSAKAVDFEAAKLAMKKLSSLARAVVAGHGTQVLPEGAAP